MQALTGRRGAARRLVATGAVVLSAVLVGVVAGTAGGTPSSGTSATVFSRGTISEDVKIHTKDVKLKTKGPTEVITQVTIFQPGATSGWHSHPGPVLVVVKSGTVTVYDESCQPRRYSAGQAFVEGPEPAVVRNEGTTVSENVATFIAPAGVPLRTEASSPCPGIL